MAWQTVKTSGRSPKSNEEDVAEKKVDSSALALEIYCGK